MTQDGRCRSCQAPIVWVKMKSGKAMPCDPAVMQVVTDDGQLVSGRMTHFATCPDAQEWSKR